MDFPILDLIDNESATEWLVNHFHPHGLKCPHCGSGVEEARPFRQTSTSQLTVYRCVVCDGIYNLYSSTVFQQKHLTPAQAVLLLRGVYQGESSRRGKKSDPHLRTRKSLEFPARTTDFTMQASSIFTMFYPYCEFH